MLDSKKDQDVLGELVKQVADPAWSGIGLRACHAFRVGALCFHVSSGRVVFVDFPEMVAVDRQRDGLGKEPGMSKLGPEQEIPIMKSLLAHDAEPI